MYDKILQLCHERGISPSKLGSEIGVSSTAVSNWKKGAALRPSTLKAVADYFNVPVSFFTDPDVVSVQIIEPNAEIMSDYKVYNLPLYESVSAGFGAYANENIVEFVPVALKSQTEAEESLVVRVIGDSMTPKIENGDLVQIRRQTSVDSGDLGVVMLDEDSGLIKKIVYGSNYIKLISLNPDYPPLVFTDAEVLRIRVVGKVTKIIREP